jgi:hypothetical protein
VRRFEAATAAGCSGAGADSGAIKANKHRFRLDAWEANVTMGVQGRGFR